MIIVGCDFHPSFQQVAILDTETGLTEEHKRMHTSGEAEGFYRRMASPALVGIETVGNDLWFVQLLQKLGHEVCVGDAAQIRASYVRRQKTDRRDAKHILQLLVEGRFPRIWIPDAEIRDHRQLLIHRQIGADTHEGQERIAAPHAKPGNTEKAEAVEHGGPGRPGVITSGSVDRSAQERSAALTGDAGWSTRKAQRCGNAIG
jgi:transposase